MCKCASFLDITVWRLHRLFFIFGIYFTLSPKYSYLPHTKEKFHVILSVWAHLVKKVFRLFFQGLAWVCEVHGIRVQHIYDLIFVLVNITIPTHRWWNATPSKNSKDIWIFVVIFGWKLQQVKVYITWINTPLCVVGDCIFFLVFFLG